MSGRALTAALFSLGSFVLGGLMLQIEDGWVEVVLVSIALVMAMYAGAVQETYNERNGKK